MIFFERIGAFFQDLPERLTRLEGNVSNAFARLVFNYPAIAGISVRATFESGVLESLPIAHNLGVTPNRWQVEYAQHNYFYRPLTADSQYVTFIRSSATLASTAVIRVWRDPQTDEEVF